MAIEYDASALGLVGHMPSGPGVIEDKLIYQKVRIVPPPISTFLLTSETNSRDIISHYKRVQTSTIQIVDELENRDYELIRNELPNVKLVQVIHVIDHNSVKKLLKFQNMLTQYYWIAGTPIYQLKN